MDGHSGHSNYIKKCLEYNIISSSDACTYKGNNRAKAGTTMPKPIKIVENTDPRLRSQKFRDNVNLVMDYMEIIFGIEIERTIGNFKKYDKIINWRLFAQNILRPTQAARVYSLWRGVPIGQSITIVLPGRTREEAIKNLDTDMYVFREWNW